MARSQELARLFQQPHSSSQRRYEICRAYFHDGSTAGQLAERFQLHVDSVRAIVRDFARDPDINSFFTVDWSGPKTSPKRTAIHQRACELRHQGHTLAETHTTLLQEGFDISESYLFRILRRAGLTATRSHRSTPQPGQSANDSPTFFLTNDRPQPETAREVIQTYASRNHVENQLGEQITFFHLDCLCSDVRLNVDFDLTLTVLADLLYRNLADRLKGFAQAGPSTLYRKFVETPGAIEITAKGVVVRLNKRAHTPLLKEAGLMRPTQAIPWLGGRCVHLMCP